MGCKKGIGRINISVKIGRVINCSGYHMEMAIRRREQEVWQACDDLWAMHGDMKIVTGDEIRDRLVALGKSRGSPNEIYKYRKTWLLKRGLSQLPPTSSEESDPISRAVRLVHEQLNGEASLRIERLEQEFTRRIEEKDQEVSQIKGALDAVMVEFSEAQRQLNSKSHHIKSLEEQLSAEIDIRKAQEKEIALNKVILTQERTVFEARLFELKSVFDGQICHWQAREHDLLSRSEQKITELSEQVRTLGHEYSDRLMELKTTLTNQEIITRQMEKKLLEARQDLQQEKDKNCALTKQMARFEQDIIKFRSEFSAKDGEVERVKAERDAWLGNARHMGICLKKSELTVARLRAIALRTAE